MIEFSARERNFIFFPLTQKSNVIGNSLSDREKLLQNQYLIFNPLSWTFLLFFCMSSSSLVSPNLLSQNYDMRQSRCMSKLSDLKAANCRDEFILQNKYKKVSTLRDDDLKDFDPAVDSVQIKPQHLQMSLRKGRQQSVKMKYKPARNYPLDIYYLMDLTYSMKDDKKTLVGMGGSLSRSLANLTENFRLGFGSFADKAVMPYINLGTEANPCKLARDNCQPTYGFKHKLKLTDDIQEFISKVNSSEITANLDNLEGS